MRWREERERARRGCVVLLRARECIVPTPGAGHTRNAHHTTRHACAICQPNEGTAIEHSVEALSTDIAGHTRPSRAGDFETVLVERGLMRTGRSECMRVGPLNPARCCSFAPCETTTSAPRVHLHTTLIKQPYIECAHVSTGIVRQRGWPSKAMSTRARSHGETTIAPRDGPSPLPPAHPLTHAPTA